MKGALLEKVRKGMAPYFAVQDPAKAGTLRFDTWDQVEAYCRQTPIQRRHKITWYIVS